MRPITRSHVAWAFVLVAVFAASVAAQDTPTPSKPCRDALCAVVFDWGNGQSAAGFATDRRYGSPSDFEAVLRQTLSDKGFRLAERNGDAKLTVLLRLSMMSAICDFMPGTNTDRSCQTVRDVALSFANADPAVKNIGSTRLNNRCGANDQVMTAVQFGRLTADFIQYLIEGEQNHLTRPAAKC